MPVKARPAPILPGWEVDAGTRYWYSSGKEKNTSGDGILTSQLTYSNLTGHSGEFFARVDTPSGVFVKGYVGAGALAGGKATDEDWGNATDAKTGFQVTDSTASGWLNYAAADVGYSVLRDWNYKFGPFVGYSYFRQNTNTYGCSFPVPAGQRAWRNEWCGRYAEHTHPHAGRDLAITPCRRLGCRDDMGSLGINGDVAYLPYGQYSGLDSHLLRVPITFFPQNGTGRGVQTELILTYLVPRISSSASADATGRCGRRAPRRAVMATAVGVQFIPARSVYREHRARRRVRASELSVRHASVVRITPVACATATGPPRRRQKNRRAPHSRPPALRW